MTTTNVFQGLQGDKKTSKVLRAPGGGSSISIGMFGGEETKPNEPTPVAAQDTAPKDEEPAAASEQGQGDGADSTSAEGTAAGMSTPKNQDRNPITGFGMGDSDESSSRKKHFVSSGSYNPITGEEAPAEQKPRRQPPGGFSSGIF